ncbi:MAG: sulfur carrier protein ThiS [Oscillospiraceae bacterium]|nr:sulfur carrier protein ThiS [Oscillospiraceae bacterium]
MAKINGKTVPEADGMSVSGYIASAGYVSGRIAVEYNEAILPREDYDKTIIASSDNVEIVEFMGGG